MENNINNDVNKIGDKNTGQINIWLIVFLVVLLSLALSNAFINFQHQAWPDLAFSLCMILFLAPIPENVRFLSSKLASEEHRAPSVSALHALAMVAFVAGLVTKLI